MDNRRPPRNQSFGSRPFNDRPKRGPGPRPGQLARNEPPRDSSRPHTGPNDRFQTRSRSDAAPFDRRPPSDRYGQPSDGRGRRYDPASRFGPSGRYGNPRKAVLKKDEPLPITSDLQITDGKHRGHLLVNSLSPGAKPTGRKLREIMFKVASRRVRAGRFLDLGAGMGMVGLEAISRGAMVGTFVERSARMCSFIRKNLGALGIKDGHGEIVEKEISPFLKDSARRKRNWDMVFVGTRCGGTDEEVYKYLRRGVPLAHGGLLLIEHASDRAFPEKLGILSRWRTIANDNSTITFYERK